jgi:transposase InsO family protein
LDRLFILSEGHLRRVLREYVDYYNCARPHQGLNQQLPIPHQPIRPMGEIRCRDVLSGLIHDYYRAAA